MVGPELLDVARFPSVTFRSTKIEGSETGKGVYELQITGQLTLHGFSRPTVVQARVEVAGEALTATGSFVIRHTDFGLSPVSVAGVVKVKNEIAIDYKIQAAVRTASGGVSVPPPGGNQGGARGHATGRRMTHPAGSSEVEASPDAAVREIRDQGVFLGALAPAFVVGVGMPVR